MTTIPSLTIRPPSSSEELLQHIRGEVQVAQSFSPDPLPEDAVERRLHKLTAAPGYRQEQVRGAYLDDKQLGGYKIYERVLRVGAARLVTGCIGSVYTRAETRNQGVATALMQDAIAYAQAHDYPLLLLDGIPKFYYRYGYNNVHSVSIYDIDCQAMMAVPASPYTIRPFSLDDAASLLALYKHHIGPYTGSFERSIEQQLHWMRTLEPHQLWLAVGPTDQVRGYLFLSDIQARGEMPDTSARELAVDDWPATVALIQHHMRQVAEREGQHAPSACLYTLPHTSPVLQWLEENLEIADVSAWGSPAFGWTVREQTFHHRSAGWMARIVSLPALTRAMLPTWQSRWQRSLIRWSGNISLAIDDRIVTLRISGPDLQLLYNVTTANALSLTPQAFTQAIFGYRSLADALPSLDDERATVLKSLFPTGQTWIPVSDWF